MNTTVSRTVSIFSILSPLAEARKFPIRSIFFQHLQLPRHIYTNMTKTRTHARAHISLLEQDDCQATRTDIGIDIAQGFNSVTVRGDSI